MFVRVLVSLFVLGGIGRSELAWENPSREFRRRAEEKELVVDFAFRNAGNEAVTITKVTSTCGCTTTELEKKTYLPGETGKLVARFVFGGRQGLQSKTVTVSTDDGKVTPLNFSCLITAEPLSVEQTLVLWRIGEESKAKSVELAVSPDVPLHVTGVASSNRRITAVLEPERRGDQFSISIQPEDTTRQESGEVFVQTDYPPEGPRAYCIHVRIK